WPTADLPGPEGQRFHMDPKLSFPQARRWGYLTPSVQWVGNAYNLTERYPLPTNAMHISVPRFDVDSGLYLDRKIHYFDYSYTQTLEPRLYYLNVPYRNQANIPTFESGYMIFSADQLFRNNRFSGFDRIGDANQLAYGVTSRWLRDADGEEKASVTVGQLAYFANRRVFLCYNPSGFCQEEPLVLGFLSPTEQFSPVASHAVYHMNHLWSVIGDYVWDPATRATNNGQLNLHYQRENNRLFNVGYTYLVNGDLTQMGATPANRALNQASASYAWPLNDYWSTVGAYGYNVSKNYEMMALFGVQYDSCCWAMRLLAGRTFRNLNNIALIQPQSQPEYTNSVFLQLMLKGLGSVGNASPTSILQTFVPGYQDTFRS
ncbi:MAG: LPS-assembly protein LptD, partial [Methylococcales bacterium]|nr:LPS-assembly protein LptD [Methylococcales bacterium]